MNKPFHPPQVLGRGGDVLIAAGKVLGWGDVDVATPALGRRGDVLIAAGRALGWGDLDVAAPALGRKGDVFIELPSFHGCVRAVHFRKSGAVRSAIMPRCFAAAANCCRYIAKAPYVLNAGRP
jgi:hypothetical protein